VRADPSFGTAARRIADEMRAAPDVADVLGELLDAR
jgi:hypothetical protein